VKPGRSSTRSTSKRPPRAEAQVDLHLLEHEELGVITALGSADLDNVLDVNALLDNVLLKQYSVQFPDPTPDATIQAYLVADLQAKGYAV
jgi:hypothetical protein